ncbi:LysM peptidoglycan-binding domain-containing protein [Pedosphaera parvula]|nr:LysM domain-containing protein [Pedosphaera parvula]
MRMFLIASVGLNLVLAITLLVPRHGVSTNNLAGAAEPNPGGDSTNGKPKVILRRQFFSWDELESPDYQAYIKNLRDIGCPESTIRDIIVADINQVYAKKKQNQALTADQQWWRKDPDPAVTGKLNVLDQERRATLANLLGPDWDANNPTNQSPKVVALNGPMLSDLSPDAKASVQEIALRSQQQTAALVDAAREQNIPPDSAELAKIREQTRQDLSKVLNPAQLEEFLLRYSQTATTLRTELQSLNVSADEFRNIFRTTDSIERQLQSLTGNDSTTAQQRAQLQQQRDLAIRTILGADRFQTYQGVRDASYADALNAAQQAGAPATAVQPVYQINQATAQEQSRIQNDPTLSDEEKASQLAAINQQQKQASDQVLGLAPPPAPTTPTPPPLPPLIYSYRGGETLDQIALQYGSTIPEILGANPNLNPNVIQRGQRILIPPTPSPLPSYYVPRTPPSILSSPP